MLLLPLVLGAIIFWLAYVYMSQEKRKVKLPGPKGLPLIGCLHKLEKQFHLMTYRWSAKYGKAIYFNILSENFVSISDVKMGREMFSMEAFNGRPIFDLFLLVEGEKLGVINTDGELWETHRRFTLRHLRDFGFGKNTMEMLIMDEVQEFIENLKQRNEKPCGSIKALFSLAVVNSLWTLVSGKRYKQDDPKLRALSKYLDRALTETAKSGGIIFFFPWLRYIIPEFTGYTATRQAFHQLREFVVEAVQEHKKTFQPDTCRDFIDAYLKESYSANDPRSSFYGEAGEKQLTAVVGDLFFAGTDTTSTTLAWAVLYLATHQEVQQKLQAEIYSITGNTRPVSLADRPKAPILLATIDEVFRKSSILPSGVNHQALRDVTYQGVRYPKGTMIGLNVYYIHHNPELWEEPDKFRPSRFLSEDEKVYKKSENVIPFSVGRRSCLGESLARDTIFLFMGNVFQTFHVLPDSNNPNPSLEPALGISLNPQEYSVIFKPRNE